MEVDGGMEDGGWMDGWIDRLRMKKASAFFMLRRERQMDGWTDGWMDGWKDG